VKARITSICLKTVDYPLGKAESHIAGLPAIAENLSPARYRPVARLSDWRERP
jgi:hypothetical protein